MSTSDLKIMKELEASFLTAIDTHEGIIHKISHAWSRNRADEEDLYQEIVYQLWKAYPSFKGDSNLSTWIYSVALKSAMLPFRRNKVRIELPGVLPDRPSDERVNDGIDDQLFRIFQRLEDIDRAVLVLVMQGFAAKEIGAVLDLSHKAVTMRMSRVRGIVEWTK